MKTKSLSETRAPFGNLPLQSRPRERIYASLILLLLLCLLWPAAIQASDYTYTTNSGKITITKYTGSGGDVSIPDNFNGWPVTSIAYGAFSSCTGLVSIVIPDSVITIGDSAFGWCENMSSVTFGNSVKSIGSQAFYVCSSLATINIPNNVSTIGGDAFRFSGRLTNVILGSGVTNLGNTAFGQCGSLAAIMVDPANPFYRSVDGVLFNKGETALVVFPCAKPGSYSVPDTVTNLGYAVFHDCINLTNLAIGTGITSIRRYEFLGCSNLVTVLLPNTVTLIDSYAFFSCASLSSIVIPDSVTSIGGGAFGSCESLVTVTIGRGLTSIAGSLFNGLSSLSEINVNPLNPACSGVDGILFDKNQFTLIRCPARKSGSYLIPETVTTIGGYAFAGCLMLTNITIPPSVAAIESGAFGSCASLGCIIIPDEVTTIADNTFASCYGLTNVVIGNSVRSIESSAFYYCSSLNSITIPSSVTNIGSTVFDSCMSLTRIDVDPNNPNYSSLDGVLLDKAQTTLIQCPGGKTGTYVIPESVTSLGTRAFSRCASLNGVTIPRSVTYISTRAFYRCSSLTAVYFRGNAPNSSSSIFDYAPNVIVYYLPGTTGWGATFGGQPTVLWDTQVKPNDPDFGIGTNGFGFTITGNTNLAVVVEACTNLANPVWINLGTNSLSSGPSFFSDPQWANYPTRFYRIRSP